MVRHQRIHVLARRSFKEDAKGSLGFIDIYNVCRRQILFLTNFERAELKHERMGAGIWPIVRNEPSQLLTLFVQDRAPKWEALSPGQNRDNGQLNLLNLTVNGANIVH